MRAQRGTAACSWPGLPTPALLPVPAPHLLHPVRCAFQLLPLLVERLQDAPRHLRRLGDDLRRRESKMQGDANKFDMMCHHDGSSTHACTCSHACTCNATQGQACVLAPPIPSQRLHA